jgi:hypothetical protein
MSVSFPPKSLLLIASVLALSSPALAQTGGWGGAGWGRGYDNGFGGDGFGGGWGNSWNRGPERDRSREGRISVDRFVSKDPLVAGLGHGAIVVAAPTRGAQYVEQLDRELFETALVGQLIKAGYDTAQAHPEGGQVIEMTITHAELEPPGEKHKPVSGEAAIGASNRGMGYSLALNVDLSKPLPPLISTRLDVRIRDRATDTVLWEGRAQVATRPGTKGWSGQQTADRLAAALLDGFPRATDKASRPR